MNNDLRVSAIAAIVIAAALYQAGCASNSVQNPLGKLNLPSPWATIEAADDGAMQPSRVTGKRGSPNNGQLALELLRGRGLERAGEQDKARRLYEGLREQHPGNLEVVHRLGVVADAQRRHAEAEGMFLFVLQQEPRNAEVLADLGYCYFLQGQLTKAESALLKAVAAEPGNPRYRNNLGLVAGHQGRYDDALTHFRQAGTQADAYYNLAFVYAAQDQAEKAKHCFQLALNEDPTHGKSREARRSFEEFDRLPERLRKDLLVTDGRVRYVPFIEGQGNGVRQAVHSAELPTSRDASQATRALQLQSRGVLNRKSREGEAPAEPP
ncbi:MAG: tetratricopeptide repeat protein [Pirellulaceae bacterium]